MPFAESERANFFLEIFDSISIHLEEEVSNDSAYFSPEIKYNSTDEFFATFGFLTGLNSNVDDAYNLVQNII